MEMKDYVIVSWNEMLSDICKKYQLCLDDVKNLGNVKEMEQKIITMADLCDFANKKIELQNCDGNDWD